MKIALVHDYLKEMGGAEVVLIALKEMFPEATVYTAYKFPKYWGWAEQIMNNWDIKESFGKYLPGLPKFISYYTVISPWFFRNLDLSSYDLVIVSATGAYFPCAVKIGAHTKLIVYCHTPPRYLYGYPTANSLRKKWYVKPIDALINHVLRMVDFKLAQRPHVYIANSEEVKRRIQKFYRRESEVVYPPVVVPEILSVHSMPPTKSDYYLMVTRVVGSKNIDLAVRTARKYGFRLVIAGRRINKDIDLTGVEYVGEVSEEKKVELIRGSLGVLCLEEYADFGITAVEPQIYGVPVIAYKGGGYLESVIDGRTGVFFDQMTEESLHGAIIKSKDLVIDDEDIKGVAKRFSKDEFKSGIKRVLKRYE